MTRLPSRTRNRLLLGTLLAAGACILWLSPLRDHLTREGIRTAVESVRAAWYAPLVLIALYAAGCVFAVPASLFIIAAGAIWGWVLGGTYAMAGGVLGAMASFFVGRSFVGTGTRSWRAAQVLERHLHGSEFQSLLIVRLLPVLPFAVLNYGAGLLRVKTSAFVLSTAIGLIPSNYVFAWSADEIFNGSLTGGAVMRRLFAAAAVSLAAVAIPAVAARFMPRRPTSA